MRVRNTTSCSRKCSRICVDAPDGFDYAAAPLTGPDVSRSLPDQRIKETADGLDG